MSSARSSLTSVDVDGEISTSRNVVDGQGSTSRNVVDGQGSTSRNVADGEISTSWAVAVGERSTSTSVTDGQRSTSTSVTNDQGSTSINVVYSEILTSTNEHDTEDGASVVDFDSDKFWRSVKVYKCERFVPSGQVDSTIKPLPVCSCGEILDKHKEIHSTKRDRDRYEDDIKGTKCQHPDDAIHPAIKSSDICECGEILEFHDWTVRAKINLDMNQPRWDSCRDSKLVETNAHGHVASFKFERTFGDVQKSSEYVRLADCTDMTIVYDILVKVWGLSPPQLLVSILGGQKCSNDALNRSFTDSVLDDTTLGETRGWIVADGTYMDYGTMSMSFIGKMDDETNMDRSDTVLVGITAWGDVAGREGLIQDDSYVNYDVDNYRGKKATFLDLSMSHLLLVDAVPVTERSRKVDEFQHRFLQYLQEKVMSGHALPTVNVLFNGSERDLCRALQTVERIPTLVVKGSGGAADILAAALKGQDEPTLREMIKTKLPGEANIEGCMTLVKKCRGYIDRFSIFDNNSEEQKLNIKMWSLLQSDDKGILSQLITVLTWDRCDLAKDIFKRSHDRLKLEELEKFVLLALDMDRANFIELLLSERYDVGRALTRQNIEKLYNEQPTDSLIKRLLRRKDMYNNECITWKSRMLLSLNIEDDRRFTLENVDELICKYCYDSYKSSNVYVRLRELILHRTLHRTLHLFHPVRDMFIWALLANKFDIARLLWPKQDSPMAAALIARALLRSLSHEMPIVHNDLMKHKFADQAEYYESLALGVLNQCYEAGDNWDKKWLITPAEFLLIKKQTDFGGVTCLQVACESECKTFMAHDSMKRLLNKGWFGKISVENSFVRVLISLFIPGLFFFLLTFREDEMGYESSNVSTRSDSHQTSSKCADLHRKLKCYLERVYDFYTSPMVIFSYNCVAYLLFLLLFSHMVLYESDYSFNNPLQIALASWVGLQLYEECIQFTTYFSYYTKQISNLFYVSGGILFFTAYGISSNSGADQSRETSKYLMCLSMTAYYFRLLGMLSAVRQIGPMIIMMKKMIFDLIYFSLFISVFFVAYSIVRVSLLYPIESRHYDLYLYSLLRAGYWSMLGEIQTYLQSDLESGNCTFNGGPSNVTNCTTAQLVMAPVMGVYILFINVLMFNVLIALISHRFQETQKERDVIWSLQRYRLINEYFRRPTLPFSMIRYFLTFLVLCCLRQSIMGIHVQPNQSWEQNIEDMFNKHHTHDLKVFECRNAKVFYHRWTTEPHQAKSRGIQCQLETSP